MSETVATGASRPSAPGSTIIEERSIARSLGLAAICGIIFFSVSGGPYGLEDTIGEAGAGMGLLLIIVTPFIWSLPTALMVAELGTTMPVQGGYYHWAKTALGPFWGFMIGWLMWLMSWVDMALYPVLFTDYASYFFPELGTGPEGNPALRWVVGAAVIWFFGYLNIRGSKLIGDSSRLFGALVIAPFVLVTVLGLFKLQINPTTPFIIEGKSPFAAFGAGLFVVMWNYMGWDGLSTVAGEIENPKRNYPRALAITIPLITLVYLVPTVVSLAAVGTEDVSWTAGAYTVVAEKVAGHWLGVVLTIAALFSAVGLFSAWMLANSRIPFSLADDGYLPAAIAKIHPKYGTPVNSIILCCLICSVFIFGPFQSLVAIDVTIYAMALMIEFAALIALRKRHPELERPYRVPGGWVGVITITILPALVIGTAVYFQVLDVGAFQGIGWPLIAAATGPLLFPFLSRMKARKGVDRTYTIEMIAAGNFEREAN